MRKILFFLLFSMPLLHAQPINVIPKPSSVQMGRGVFAINFGQTLTTRGNDSRLEEIANEFRLTLSGEANTKINRGEFNPLGSNIVLEVAPSANKEAYTLTVQPNLITIKGQPEGIFWGTQTLRQLIRLENGVSIVPCLTIRDQPKFPWRGSMLDVSRHFFTVEYVKTYLDWLAYYKMNVFHWHLTDDQGWRIEIKKYPRLTEQAAWRTEADGSRYGGFYTQEQIKDVVDYARRLNITVVPEIEMPGHSQAAISAYPSLGCTGEQIPVGTIWGVMKDVYCVSKPETVSFIKDVLDEVITLFPSKFIHTGGDEVPKDRWKEHAPTQAFMQQKGIKNENELQSWFIKQIDEYVRSKGRQITGWDEILEGGLAKGATVQVWRDMAHAKTVARLGNKVVASPTSHAYIDAQPNNLPLQKVYSFNPIPAGLTAAQQRNIMGGEANIWTEHITTANFMPMVFPRILAMSEALWTTSAKSYPDFKRRLEAYHYSKMKGLGVNYGPEDKALMHINTSFDAATRNVQVNVEKNVASLSVHYTTDGSKPTLQSPEYTPDVRFDREGTYSVQAFFGDEAYLFPRTFTIKPHLAWGKSYTLKTPNSPKYTGTGASSLTDGVTGSADFHDGLSQGWEGENMEATLDLGASTAISDISAGFLQHTPSWILMPTSVTFSVSNDGKTWTTLGSVPTDVDPKNETYIRKDMHIAAPSGTQARYLRVAAQNASPLPAWHIGAGGKAWIFCDEITVK
jgi:hexosaminidase